MAISDTDAGVHPDDAFGNSTWRSDLSALQSLIECIKLPLVSKERVLQSSNQAAQLFHVSVADDNLAALHDELLFVYRDFPRLRSLLVFGLRLHVAFDFLPRIRFRRSVADLLLHPSLVLTGINFKPNEEGKDSSD
jgi:hypothetical protein